MTIEMMIEMKIENDDRNDDTIRGNKNSSLGTNSVSVIVAPKKFNKNGHPVERVLKKIKLIRSFSLYTPLDFLSRHKLYIDTSSLFSELSGNSISSRT